MDSRHVDGRDRIVASGEMADRVRAFDWTATLLGTIETWSERLVASVEAVLAAPQLATVAIGPMRTFIYNDEASRHYGLQHPHVLGLPLADAFPHEFATVEAVYDRVFAGESLHLPAQPLDPARTGKQEIFDAYLSPVRGPDGSVIAAHMAGFAVGKRLSAERKLRENEERQTFLLALGDRMRSENNADAIIAAAAGMLGQHLRASRIVFAEIDDATGVARIRPGWNAVGAQAHSAEARVADFGGPLLEDLRAGRVVRYDDVGEPPFARADQEALHVIGVKAGIGAPLIVGGRFVASLNVYQHKSRWWTDGEVSLVVEVADRLWSSVERARSEAALGASEQRLALAFGALPVGIAIVNAAGELVTINEEMRRFLPTGRLPSLDPERSGRWQSWDADGRSVRPENFPSARALRGEAASSGVQMLYRDDSNVEVWTEVKSVPLPDADGRVIGAITVVVDVDRVKRSEEAAQASEERLRQFGEASQDILWLRDAATLQWVYLTPAFETVYGLSREKALAGDNYRNWQDLIVPEDLDDAVDSIAKAGRGEWVTLEYRIRRSSDGAIRWLRDTDFPITDEAGNVVLIGGVGHDFTDVREAELRLQTLVEGIPQLVWRAVNAGEWTWASPQWSEYTGQHEADYRGRGWLMPLHPDDHVHAREAWAHAVEQGGFDVEYRIKRQSDEEYRWFQTRAAPVRDPAGSIIEWLGTSTDINDLRELQDRQHVLVAELQHRTRNLMAVVRAMGARQSAPAPIWRISASASAIDWTRSLGFRACFRG